MNVPRTPVTWWCEHRNTVLYDCSYYLWYSLRQLQIEILNSLTSLPSSLIASLAPHIYMHHVQDTGTRRAVNQTAPPDLHPNSPGPSTLIATWAQESPISVPTPLIPVATVV